MTDECYVCEYMIFSVSVCVHVHVCMCRVFACCGASAQVRGQQIPCLKQVFLLATGYHCQASCPESFPGLSYLPSYSRIADIVGPHCHLIWLYMSSDDLKSGSQVCVESMLTSGPSSHPPNMFG